MGIATGCGHVGFDDVADLADVQCAGQFALGTFDHTTCSADGVVLDGASATGQFTSRVFARPSGRAWSTLAWGPDAPYGKPLPDGGAHEGGYASYDVEMTGNIVLLHLDGSGSPIAGDMLADASGRGNDFTIAAINAGSPISYAPGLVGTALDKTLEMYAYRTLTTTSDLQFGASDFTWAVWAKTTDDCSRGNTTNSVYWGTQNEPTPNPHIWLGCGSNSVLNCVANVNTVEGFYRGDSGTGDGGCASSTSATNDGRWHHYVLTKSGQAPIVVTFWADGVAGVQCPGATSPTVTWTPPNQFDFTAFRPDDTTIGDVFSAIGTFDEAAIWTRALSATEIEAVYARAALDLELVARFCARADCSDAPDFVGPDGTTGTTFRDPAQALGPPDPVAIAAVGDPSLPFAQYRATLTTLRTDLTPKLHEVAFAVR